MSYWAKGSAKSPRKPAWAKKMKGLLGRGGQSSLHGPPCPGQAGFVMLGELLPPHPATTCNPKGYTWW